MRLDDKTNVIMTDLGDFVYTPILSSAAVFDQYMQLGLGLELDRSMVLT